MKKKKSKSEKYCCFQEKKISSQLQTNPLWIRTRMVREILPIKVIYSLIKPQAVNWRFTVYPMCSKKQAIKYSQNWLTTDCHRKTREDMYFKLFLLDHYTLYYVVSRCCEVSERQCIFPKTSQYLEQNCYGYFSTLPQTSKNIVVAKLIVLSQVSKS